MLSPNPWLSHLSTGRTLYVVENRIFWTNRVEAYSKECEQRSLQQLGDGDGATATVKGKDRNREPITCNPFVATNYSIVLFLIL